MSHSATSDAPENEQPSSSGASASRRPSIVGQGVDRVYEHIHHWPLRARIIAVLAGLMAISTFAIGMASTWQLHGYLLQRQDAELTAAAPTLVASTLQQEAIRQETQTPTSLPTNVYAIRLVGPYRIVDLPPPGGGEPNFPVVNAKTVEERGGKPYTVGSKNGSDEQWRVVEGIDASTGQPYAVAVTLESLQRVVRRMQVLTIVVSSLALLGAIVAALFAVRRALRPLRGIEDTAAGIASGDMSRRVPNPGTGDEVESLAASLNVMLGKIDESMRSKDRSEESMRRFVADASHELRTPLATVRGYAELYRHGAMSKPEDVAAGMRRIEDEATRMSAMVEDLLLLSRLEAEQRAKTSSNLPGAASAKQREFTEVDLTVLAADMVSDAEARGSTLKLRLIGLNGPLGPVEVHGDEQRLRQVLTNLLTNAQRYAGENTAVEVKVGEADGGGVIQVIDHGPGIPQDVRDHVFERFYRADVARNRAAGSTGLGLSIVAAIVGAHGGRITVTETPGGGATFTVWLPSAASAPVDTQTGDQGRPIN